MKNKAKASAMVLAAIVLGLLYWKHCTNDAVDLNLHAETDNSFKASINKRVIFSKQERPSSTSTVHSNLIGSSHAFPADESAEWRSPINFFGKVVDENGWPIPAAVVRFSWSDTSENGASEEVTASKANGTFSLKNKQGKVLDVEISGVAGYPTTNGARRSFEYGFAQQDRHLPDERNPVIFRWKLQRNVEPLVAWTAGMKVDARGKTTTLRLLPVGVISDDGDIRVETTSGYEDRFGRFDWSCKVTIRSGGFVKSDEEFPFLAPEAGYAQTLEWSMKASDPSWQAGPDLEYYYFKFGDPVRYGRMRISFLLTGLQRSNNSGFGLLYWINPSGSRVLESDFSRPSDIPDAILYGRR